MQSWFFLEDHEHSTMQGTAVIALTPQNKSPEEGITLPIWQIRKLRLGEVEEVSPSHMARWYDMNQDQPPKAIYTLYHPVKFTF